MLRSALAILALAVAGQAFAADSPDTAPADPLLERYQAAAERKDWTAAAAVMRDALGANPRNADYHNLYAYALRKAGTREMDLVFKHYNEALRLDPKHRGAHEYLGEAYLMVGNVAKAKEHLRQLDKFCFFGCSEYTQLKNAIAEHEKKGR